MLSSDFWQQGPVFIKTLEPESCPTKHVIDPSYPKTIESVNMLEESINELDATTMKLCNKFKCFKICVIQMFVLAE